ncbi:MAG: hypothetical protein IPK17_13485 [Chloroflexi bacterium]|uniref:hypothetical protein n=1 Tax=Candidatus Flexifilum breve TaxID=3140694 RepID=UPI0031360045|nr:hypothetical protein [Chloroflexota bacterium]
MPGVGPRSGHWSARSCSPDYDPAQAEVDAQGRLLRRPMLVPAVGAGLERLTYPLGKQPIETADAGSELLRGFTPVKPKRMGWFTPVVPAETLDSLQVREQENYAADMRGEELEQHLTEVTQSAGGKSSQAAMERASGRLERSAETLERARRALTGSLRLTGTADVTGVLGDVMRLLGGRGVNGVDHLTAGALLAQAVGITPLPNGQSPVSGDLTRFRLFLDQAARLGLSPEQTERVSQEVKATPERHLTPETRS